MAACMLAACATASGQGAAEPADIRIAGSEVFPESVTSDDAGNIYVGSGHGIIYRATPGSDVAAAWIEPAAGDPLQSLFGVLADDRHGRLWNCANPDLFAADAQGTAELRAYDLATGELEARYAFPAGEPAACNDIAVAPDGTVFATETLGGRIFALPPGAGALNLWASGEALVGVDGIAFAEDGTMYINNVRQNLVQRVERAGDGSYGGLATLELSQPVEGPDGLRPLGGKRFLQSEGPAGRVALVTIEGDRARIETLREGLESAPAVTNVGDVGYAIEGKIGYRIDPELQGQDPGDFFIRAFPLPEGL